MYLDPHTTQPASPEEGMEEGEVEEEEDCSYHCPRYRTTGGGRGEKEHVKEIGSKRIRIRNTENETIISDRVEFLFLTWTQVCLWLSSAGVILYCTVLSASIRPACTILYRILN